MTNYWNYTNYIKIQLQKVPLTLIVSVLWSHFIHFFFISFCPACIRFKNSSASFCSSSLTTALPITSHLKGAVNLFLDKNSRSFYLTIFYSYFLISPTLYQHFMVCISSHRIRLVVSVFYLHLQLYYILFLHPYPHISFSTHHKTYTQYWRFYIYQL